MRYRKSALDDRGTLDIPFKLIVAIMMIGSVMPLGFISYRNVSREKFEMKIEKELNSLCICAEKISMYGNLSKSEIEIDLQGNIFADIEYVKIGNSFGSYSDVIKYKFEWEKSSNHLNIDEIHFCSYQNDTLLLKSGKHTLVLTHVESPGSSYISITKK